MLERNILDRKIVAYFEHEFHNPNIPSDVSEIVEAGFNHVVLCVSEVSLNDPQKLELLDQGVQLMGSANLVVWADPWGVGKVFGGEAKSLLSSRGITPCFCNPEFDSEMNRWIDVATRLGVQGVFYDEPDQTKCTKHDTLDLIAHYTEISHKNGLFNSVCIPADDRRLSLFRQIAALPYINDIATDPYFPNAFKVINPEERVKYFQFWATTISDLARENHISSHLWIQGFDIKTDDLKLIEESAHAMADKVDGLAFWGYKGCATLFPNATDNASPIAVWEKAKQVFGNIQPKSIPSSLPVAL